MNRKLTKSDVKVVADLIQKEIDETEREYFKVKTQLELGLPAYFGQIEDITEEDKQKLQVSFETVLLKTLEVKLNYLKQLKSNFEL